MFFARRDALQAGTCSLAAGSKSEGRGFESHIEHDRDFSVTANTQVEFDTGSMGRSSH